MKQHKLDNAINLYIDGLVGGDLHRMLCKCVTDGMRQHTPGMGAGREGLLTAWQPLIDRHDRRFVLPLRGFVDGATVVPHTFQSFGYREVERVVFDIFDTGDDDRIIAHWNVASPLGGITAGGYSPIDGPHIVEDVPATDANKHLIAAYLGHRDVGRPETADGYLADTFVDHQPLAAPPRAAAAEPLATRLVRLLGRGNFVAALTDTSDGVAGRRACDLYRVAQGMIIERWNATQPGTATTTTAPAARAIGRRPAPTHTPARTAQYRRYTRHVAGRNERSAPAAGTAAPSPPVPWARVR